MVDSPSHPIILARSIPTVGATPQDYQTDTSMTIKEIASMLGFPSQAFFCKYFKRYTSYSPKEYRINHKS